MAAKKGAKTGSGTLYELKHKHGSFHDWETDLTINRDEQVEIAEPVGKATAAAIAAGRLVKAEEKKEEVAAE